MHNKICINQQVSNDIINDLVNLLSSIDNVVGLVLIGSLATNNSDQYSDIDLVVIVEKDVKKEILRWEEYFGTSEGILISQIITPNKWLCTLQSRNESIIKVDFDFYNYQDLHWLLKDSFLYGIGLCDGKIIFERENLLSKIYRDNHTKKLNQNPQVSINQFIINVYNAIRMNRRGEFFEAIDILNRLRDPFIISLLGIYYNFPFENSRKLESKLSGKSIESLMKTYCTPTKSEINKTIKHTVQFFWELVSLNKIELTTSQLNSKNHLTIFLTNEGTK